MSLQIAFFCNKSVSFFFYDNLAIPIHSLYLFWRFVKKYFLFLSFHFSFLIMIMLIIYCA